MIYDNHPCLNCYANSYSCDGGCRAKDEYDLAVRRWEAVLIINEILAELERAESKHKPMATPHHGLSVIRAEYLELEREVYAEKSDTLNERMVEECIHVGAMAIRFLKDLRK